MTINTAVTSGRCAFCKRLVNHVHCSACGSSYIYGYATRRDVVSVVNDKGRTEQVSLRVYKCRRCSCVFNEHAVCEAPEAGLTMRSKRNIESAAETLSRNEDGTQNPNRQELLTKLFANAKGGGQ